MQQAARIHLCQRGTGPGLLAQKGRVQPAAELKSMPNVMLRFAETIASFCAGLGEWNKRDYRHIHSGKRQGLRGKWVVKLSLVMKGSGAACMQTCRRMTLKLCRLLKIKQKKIFSFKNFCSWLTSWCTAAHAMPTGASEYRERTEKSQDGRKHGALNVVCEHFYETWISSEPGEGSKEIF